MILPFSVAEHGSRASRSLGDHSVLSAIAPRSGLKRALAVVPAARLNKSGLAPWQERRAKEMLAADLTGATPLAEIAAACGLSVCSAGKSVEAPAFGGACRSDRHRGGLLDGRELRLLIGGHEALDENRRI